MSYTKQGVRNLNTIKAPVTKLTPENCHPHQPGQPYEGTAYPNVAFDNYETDDVDPGWPAILTDCIKCGKTLKTHYIFK
jgi:hypothetical protein